MPNEMPPELQEEQNNKPQPKLMQKGSIRDYFMKMGSIGHMTKDETDQLVKENEEAKRRLVELGLPFFQTYGPKDTLEETAALIPEAMKNSPNSRFLVRCAPKEINSQFKIERAMGITWQEVVEIINNNLPGGKENYSVEIREHWEPEYSGTIISNGSGKVLVEMAKGEHRELEKKSASDFMHGQYGLGKTFHTSFNYTEGMTEDEKKIMTGALEYLIPGFEKKSIIERESIEKLKIYAEFVYSSKQGYRFIDISDEDFWTKL